MQIKQESIPVGCVSLACQPYVFRLPDGRARDAMSEGRRGPLVSTVRANASWVMVTWGPPSPVDRQTFMKALPSRNVVGGR